MSLSTYTNIPSARTTNFYVGFLFLLSVVVIIGTLFRVSLLVIYPIVVIAIGIFLRYRITAYLVFLCLILFLGSVLSFLNGGFITYKILSLYYMLPLLLLLFGRPGMNVNPAITTRQFFYWLTIIAIINDIVGLGQVILNPISDDSFIGIYSGFSVSMNGLVILNAVLFFYHFATYLSTRSVRDLLLALFFLIACVLGFYGAGLVIIVLAFILTFFRFRLGSILKVLVISLVSLIAVYYLLLNIKPAVLEYNISNVKKIASFDVEKGPRKIRSFYNYATSYPKDVKDFLFGSGPGTFNSRTAFIIGSPSYFSAAAPIKSESKPFYFRNYAYTLWNESNTSQALYQDGFRNQPFSSILAFLGEYGLIFTAFFFIFYLYYFNELHRRVKDLPNRKIHSYLLLQRFFLILLPLLLLIDNYFEYPEIMLVLIVPIKLMEMEMLQGISGHHLKN